MVLKSGSTSKDALVANNKAFEAKGSTLVGGRNAPASDAHVVVRGSARTIVLTTLDTESGCEPAEFSYPADVTIKICPTRLVVFEGAVANTTELPANCYLESEPKSSAAPNDAASYAAYDTITKTIKIGLIVNHRAIDECVRFIPTSQEPASRRTHAHNEFCCGCSPGHKLCSRSCIRSKPGSDATPDGGVCADRGVGDVFRSCRGLAG
jgi:hypothetical protein